MSFDPNTVETKLNIAALRANVATYPMVNVLGYHAKLGSGGGTFVYVATDSTSADNGGTIIVDAAGHRWYRTDTDVMVSTAQFGVVGDCKIVGGGAITAGQHTFSSTLAGFTSTDAGRPISILGAGTAGATLVTTIASVASGVATLTAAAITSVGPSGVAAFGTDDTAAWQAFLTWLSRAEGASTTPLPGTAGFVSSGCSYISSPLTTTRGGYFPNIHTVGLEYCELVFFSLTAGQIGITLSGGNGGSIGNSWGPMTLTGGTYANGATGFRSDGRLGYILDEWTVNDFATGVELYAKNGGYVEEFLIRGGVFAGNSVALRYTADGTPGGISFRSSGFTGNTAINALAAPGARAIVISANAIVYMAPVNFTCWFTGATLIENNSARATTVFGTVTNEGTSITVAINHAVSWVDGTVYSTGGFAPGTAVINSAYYGGGVQQSTRTIYNVVDVSGASPALTFSVNDCAWFSLDRLTYLSGYVTYPTTADTHTASWAIPRGIVNHNYADGTAATYTNRPGGVNLIASGVGGFIYLCDPTTGALLTNADLSTHFVRFSLSWCSY